MASLAETFHAALTAHQAGQLAMAEQYYQDTLRQAPSLWDAVCNLGLIYQQTGRIDEALALLEPAVLSTCSTHAGLLTNLGLVYEALNRLEEADRVYQAALELEPTRVAAWVNWGQVSHRQGNTEQATLAYQQALALDPACSEAATNLALLLHQQGQNDEAWSLALTAIQEAPTQLTPWLNAGSILAVQGLYEEAAALYHQAQALGLTDPQLAMNRGMMLQAAGRLEEAIVVYRAGLAAAPADSNLHFHLATALLQNKQFTEGWQEYAWRFETEMVPRRFASGRAPVPEWQGASLAGKTLWVVCEQGFGDLFQFARYLPRLKELGAQVWLECHPGTRRLFEDLPWLAAVWELGTAPPVAVETADAWVSLMSLPQRLAVGVTELGLTQPFLQVPAEAIADWAHKLAQLAPRPRLGVVWSGSVTNLAGRRRSVSLADLAPLSALAAQWVSLQVGEAAQQIATHPVWAERMIRLDPWLTDFAETAAAILQLDGVVTIDTSIAHLAGALGKPVWLLLPAYADWRWFQDEETTPWYPTMRLFRQTTPGDWSGPVARLVDALTDWLAKHPAETVGVIPHDDKASAVSIQGGSG